MVLVQCVLVRVDLYPFDSAAERVLWWSKRFDGRITDARVLCVAGDKPHMRFEAEMINTLADKFHDSLGRLLSL